MRFFAIPLLMLATTVVIACGGSSSEGGDVAGGVSTRSATTSRPTPIPAPPWVTSASSPTIAASPVSVEVTATPTAQPTVNTPPPVPTQPAPGQPTAEPTQIPTATPPADVGGHGPASVVVSIQDNKFVDRTANVAAGGTVTWRQEGVAVHNIVGPGFDSGLLKPGATFSFMFATPGSYQYECTVHERMSGVVVVD